MCHKFENGGFLLYIKVTLFLLMPTFDPNDIIICKQLLIEMTALSGVLHDHPRSPILENRSLFCLRMAVIMMGCSLAGQPQVSETIDRPGDAGSFGLVLSVWKL